MAYVGGLDRADEGVEPVDVDRDPGAGWTTTLSVASGSPGNDPPGLGDQRAPPDSETSTGMPSAFSRTSSMLRRVPRVTLSDPAICSSCRCRACSTLRSTPSPSHWASQGIMSSGVVAGSR